jgi:hypothetical protein
VDRREQSCTSHWCAAHAQTVAGRAYCRRHAGVARALLEDPDCPSMPDIDNRAPSLLEWLARDLQDGITALLMATGEGDSVTTGAAHLVRVGADRGRAWERSWRLCRHTGIAQRVTLQVAERDDTQVVVKVGRTERTRMTPPWIEARRYALALDHAEDARRRAAFREAMLTAVAEGLESGSAG